jgi:ferredoxin/flavodoxin
LIFYFTGTGNCLYVARKIQEIEGGKLVNMAHALNEKKFNYKIEKGEKIGIIFPVYFWGLPTIVSEFVNKLNLKTTENPFIYTVITCGGHVGNADKNLGNLLELKNLKLNSSYSVKMPSNYIMIHDITNKENINSVMGMAEKQVKKLIERIKKNKKGYFADHGSIAIVSPIPNRLYGVLRKTKKFYATEECTNCGQCEKICPSQIIHMEDGKPEWKEKKCSHCTACINRCPSQAIEYGNSTKKRGRYVNPYIEFS